MITCKILSYADAVSLVSTSDDYTQSVGKSKEVLQQIFHNDNSTEQDYINLCAKSVHKSHIEHAQQDASNTIFIEESLKKLNHFFESHNININLEFYLILGRGIESYGLPYTRQNAIIYSTANGIQSEYLFFHEFFHVLTRSQPLLRDHVYKTFGFIKAHTELLSVDTTPILVNPDAVEYNFYKEVKFKNGEICPVVPFITTKSAKMSRFALAKLNPDLTFNSLVEINETDYGHDINTGYLAHPEEICADNFYYMIQNSPSFNENFQKNFINFFSQKQ